MKTVDFLKQVCVLLACLFFLSHCAGEDYSYTPEHELKPGPGLLSGEDGEFNLISSGDTREKEETDQDKRKSTPEKKVTEQGPTERADLFRYRY